MSTNLPWHHSIGLLEPFHAAGKECCYYNRLSTLDPWRRARVRWRRVQPSRDKQLPLERRQPRPHRCGVALVLSRFSPGSLQSAKNAASRGLSKAPAARGGQAEAVLAALHPHGDALSSEQFWRGRRDTVSERCGW